MKLDKNMYVRTKEGTIEKIIDKYEAPYGYKVIVNEDFRFKHYEHNYIKHIVKASHNIIDLIEVGDYVNGFKVIEFRNDDGDYYLGIVVPDDDWADILPLSKLTIYSIVTKQQMESMQYEV